MMMLNEELEVAREEIPVLANKTFTIYSKDELVTLPSRIVFPEDSDPNNMDWLFTALKEVGLIHSDAERTDVNICLIAHGNKVKITVFDDYTDELGYILLKSDDS